VTDGWHNCHALSWRRALKTVLGIGRYEIAPITSELYAAQPTGSCIDSQGTEVKLLEYEQINDDDDDDDNDDDDTTTSNP